MVVGVLVLALLAAGGWATVRTVWPTFSAADVVAVYDPAPPIGTGWQPGGPMARRGSTPSGVLSSLGSQTCIDAAPAFFGYLTDDALDGVQATFGSVTQDRWGISSTARYADAATAEAALDRVSAALVGCGSYTLPVQYGTVTVSVSGGTPTSGILHGDRAIFRLTIASEGTEQESTLTSLRVGNTVTWQTRNAKDGTTPTDAEAEALADALLSRLRSVARSL